MAKLLRASGGFEDVQPINGTDFSLEECQQFVGGPIQMLGAPNDCVMIMHEEGKFEGLPANTFATEIMRGIIANDDIIVGDVLVCKSDEFR